MSNVYQKLIDRLTDNYNREPGGHISKFMQLSAHHIQENEDLLQQINDWRDIDQAQGITLDYIGRNVGQDREGVEDHVFKTLIKARIIKNNSDGSIPTMIRFLSFILGVEKSAVKVTEKWREGEPVGVLIEFELEAFLKLGIYIDMFNDILNAIMPAGVNADILYHGSFMFADGDAIQEDEQHGFGDIVDDQHYHQGMFGFGDIFDTDAETETMLVDEAYYHDGEFTLEGNGDDTDGLAQTTTEYYVEGYASDDLGRGGRFGLWYKVNGWKDGTNETMKPW